MYPADLKYTREHEWVRVEGIGDGSVSPTTPSMRWETWSSWSAEAGRFAVANGKMETLESWSR